MGGAGNGNEFCERSVQFVAVKDDVVWCWIQSEARAIPTVAQVLWNHYDFLSLSFVRSCSYWVGMAIHGVIILLETEVHLFENNCIYHFMKSRIHVARLFLTKLGTSRFLLEKGGR